MVPLLQLSISRLRPLSGKVSGKDAMRRNSAQQTENISGRYHTRRLLSKVNMLRRIDSPLFFLLIDFAIRFL